MKTSTRYQSLGHRKVLVVEDIEINQYLARHIMESWGFEVSIAENGRKGLEALQNKNFDIVLMDIQMPEMDGIQATSAIRKLEDPLKATIPIIALTANTNANDTSRYFQAGMNDVLPKPIIESVLFQKISLNIRETIIAQEDEPAIFIREEIPVVSKSYDLTIIRSLSGGDEDFIVKMIALFVETIPESVAQLREATLHGEWIETGKIAHKLKSTIDSMGIASLKPVIREIEQKVKSGTDQRAIPVLVEQTTFTLEQVINELKTDFRLF